GPCIVHRLAGFNHVVDHDGVFVFPVRDRLAKFCHRAGPFLTKIDFKHRDLRREGSPNCENCFPKPIDGLYSSLVPNHECLMKGLRSCLMMSASFGYGGPLYLRETV